MSYKRGGRIKGIIIFSPTTKRQIHICRKIEYTDYGWFYALGKAVGKTYWYTESMLAGIFPVRPDRQYILFYQAFYI